MALIDDLVKELPKEIRGMVRAHIRIVAAMKMDELQQWLQQIAGKHYQGAYLSLNERMTPDERITEQERLNEMIAAYNIQNKAQSDMWRNFFYALIAVLIQSTNEEIVG